MGDIGVRPTTNESDNRSGFCARKCGWVIALGLATISGCAREGSYSRLGPAEVPPVAGVDMDPNEVVGISVLADSAEALTMLRRNGFVITGETCWAMYGRYDPETMVDPKALAKYAREIDRVMDVEDFDSAEVELDMRRATADAAKTMLPPLVTCDTMLQAYHKVYTGWLRELEQCQARLLKRWQNDLWLTLGSEEGNGLLDAAGMTRLRGMVAIACRLLDPGWKPGNQKLPPWVPEELRRIHAARGRMYSKAWDRHIEYSEFRPRGFYVGNDMLERFFRASTWWKRFGLRMDKSVELGIAIELARVCFAEELDDYLRLIRPYRTLVASPEDPSLADVWAAIPPKARLRLGEEGIPALETSEVVAALGRRFAPAIRTGHHPKELTKPPRAGEAYVLPPVYLFAGEVFTRTTRPPELMEHRPGGLDLMAALRSPTAERLLLDAAPPGHREKLREAIATSRRRFPDERKMSDVLGLTYDALAALAHPRITDRHPRFMHTQAYRRKSLQTALAGWAQHRHRWVLQGKVSGGSEGMPSFEPPPGFVEPNLEFWRRLLELCIATDAVLRDVMDDAFQEELMELAEELEATTAESTPREEHEQAADAEEFEERRSLASWQTLTAAVMRCGLIAQKQLQGRKLSAEDRRFFRGFGDLLAELTGFEGLSCSPDTPQVLTANVHREVLFRGVVHVGTGMHQVMYAAMPYRGRIWLARGVVLTYREHIARDGQVLTDDDWRRLLPELRQPSWTRDFALPPDLSSLEDLPPVGPKRLAE